MKIVVRGVVQGVGFRPTVHRVASAMGLNGYVQNNGTNVLIEVDHDAEEFIEQLKTHLPPLARIDFIDLVPGLQAAELGAGFRIVESAAGQRGVGIPNDVAMCENCRGELFDPRDRRHLYPFTNCTDCGARFSIIEDLPYDRQKTAMSEFPMCDDCRREYENPSARRFHHQTISCPACGPQFFLLDRKGERVDGEPIGTFAGKLHEGAIGVAKGWGGMHICCTLATLPRLREWYRRKEKPFAVMVRDIEAVERYALPSAFERSLLLSSHRPIVLVPKREGETTELISPGLGNIGLFLPYTEMQHVLLGQLPEDALVMTSANVPGEPMVLHDEDALQLEAEYYLLHNRRIVNRADDSVLRAFGERTFFIRKSRGHVPSSLPIPYGGAVVGLGAQENIAGALGFGGRIHQTQYIGDGSSYGVLDFLESALAYHMRLLGAEKPQAVAIDLHPGYTTRRLGKRLAEEWGAELVEVQHHWAHGAALLAETGLEEMIVLTLDGTGYGADGAAWGGEVLDCTLDGYDRIGHLQPFPLIGGEKAVYDVRRLAFAVSEMAGTESARFAKTDADLLRKLMPKSPMTTSFGRVLDMLACHLAVCCYRSYDGEPAMKLERLLARGHDTLGLMAEVKGGVVQSIPLFARIATSKQRSEDVAYSYVRALLRGLVSTAIERATQRGLDQIGLTGGVSYNHTISQMTKDLVEESGLHFVCPDQLPNGDGGISTGQAAIALKRLS